MALWRAQELTPRAPHSIGFGTARVLIEHGAHIIVISSQQSNVDSAIDRLNAHRAEAEPSLPLVTGHVGDLHDEAAFTGLLRSLAPLDHIIFTSVDKIIRGPLAEADLSDSKYLFGVKFWGSVLVAKALAAHDIVSPGGSLTLTSGLAGLRASKGAAIGGALNGGLLSLTQGLAVELAAKRIRVNAVVPGLCRTELWDKQGHSRETQEKVWAKGAEDLSVGFVGEPEDVAEAYLFFVRASYANATTVVIGEWDFFTCCWVADVSLKRFYIMEANFVPPSPLPQMVAPISRSSIASASNKD